MTPERQIKNDICAFLSILRHRGELDFWLNHSVGIWDPKRRLFRARNSVYDRNGVADICGIMKTGQALFIEVKTPKGVLSPAQKEFRELAITWNALYILARGVDDVKNILAPGLSLQ